MTDTRRIDSPITVAVDSGGDSYYIVNGYDHLDGTSGSSGGSGGSSVGGGASPGTVINYIYQNGGLTLMPTPAAPAPAVRFTYVQLEGMKIQFTDKTLNYPSAWKWTFGDGSVSLERNPTHRYSQAGSYSVTLRCWSSDGKTSSSYTVTITVVKEERQVGFTYYYSGMAVQFILDNNTEQNVLWEFGDGTYSATLNPMHTYAARGAYSVTVYLPTGESATHIVTVDTGIQLAWQDNSSDETGFRIYISENGGAYSLLATVAAGTTTLLATENIHSIDLTAANAFKVLAYNAYGDSGYSNVATVECA